MSCSTVCMGCLHGLFAPHASCSSAEAQLQAIVCTAVCSRDAVFSWRCTARVWDTRVTPWPIAPTNFMASCLALHCRGVGYKSDFMTYCTNKLYGLMFARELATRLKVCLHPSCIFYHFYITKSVQPSWRFHQKLHEKWGCQRLHIVRLSVRMYQPFPQCRITFLQSPDVSLSRFPV